MGYRESVGTNVLPWSWRNFQKPWNFLFGQSCPGGHVADPELTGWGPSASCTWCSEPGQGAGRWMDEKYRLVVESLTIPVSLVAEPDRNS